MQRAFLYGDLVFETMLWQNGHIRFLDLHIQRLRNSFALLQFEGNIDEQAINHSVSSLAKPYKTARVRLTYYRNSEGFYLPQTNQTAFDIEVFPYSSLSKNIDLVGVYPNQYKSCTSLSNLKSGNALVYILASLFAKQQQWNDAIILNEYGRVCEATSSNIIIKLDGRYITPPLSEGCVDGVFRKACLQQIDNTFPQLSEQPIIINQLQKAHEIWLCNAINGPRKVSKLLLS